MEVAQVRAVDEAERRGREPLEVPAITRQRAALCCANRAKWEWERRSGNAPAHEVEVHLRKHRKCAAARRLECTQQPE